MDPSVTEGLSLYERLDYDGAVLVLQKALAGTLSGPDRVKALETLAFAQTVLGDLSGATASFHALLDQEPGYVIDANLSPRLKTAFTQARNGWLGGRQVAFEVGSSSVAPNTVVLKISRGDPARIGSVLVRDGDGQAAPLRCVGRLCLGGQVSGGFVVEARDHRGNLLTSAGPFRSEDARPAWWLWGALGVAVVAGGVALGFALRREDAPAGSLGKAALP